MASSTMQKHGRYRIYKIHLFFTECVLNHSGIISIQLDDPLILRGKLFPEWTFEVEDKTYLEKIYYSETRTLQSISIIWIQTRCEGDPVINHQFTYPQRRSRLISWFTINIVYFGTVWN